MINAKIKFVIVLKMIYFSFILYIVNIKIIAFYLIICKQFKMEQKMMIKYLKHKTWTYSLSAYNQYTT